MDNDPTVKDGVEKKTDELGNEQENELTPSEAFGDTMNDGFGSIGNELEGAEPPKLEDETTDAEANTDSTTEGTDAEKKDEAEAVAGRVVASNFEDEKKKKSKKRTIILVVVLVLVLIGCGVAAFFILNPKEERKEAIKQDDSVQEISEFRLNDNGLSDFDLNFLRLENKDANVIYSPLSIKYALAMLKDGANGDSKKQVEDIIGDYKPKKYINSNNLSLANAMFVRDSFKNNVLDSYIDGLKSKYNAEIVYDSFKSAKPVNDWVSNKTLKLINGAIDDQTINQASFALINALAIDQAWNYAFQCYSMDKNSVPPCTRMNIAYQHLKYDMPVVGMLGGEESYDAMDFNNLKNRKSVKIAGSFNRYDIIKDQGEENIKAKVTEKYKEWLKSEDGKLAIENYKEYPEYATSNPEDVDAFIAQYMKELKENYGKSGRSTDYYIADKDDVKVFAKDLKEYDGNTLQYVAIMPKEGDLKSFIKDLNADKTKKYIESLQELKLENFKDGVITTIVGHIPLFKYKYDLNLMDDLKELGVKDVFDKSKADLSNMVKGDEIYISTANHSATIEFSNTGIKAGAATIFIGAGAGAPEFDYLWDVPEVKIDMTFDKPFLYLIRDKKTGEVWFAGTVYEPLEKKS